MEGQTTKRLEQRTSRLPSIGFLAAAGVSIAGSALLTLKKSPTWGNFVGLWAPTILILGLYNKLVKVAGSERGLMGA